MPASNPTAAPSQEALRAFLCDPQSFPDRTRRVRLLETHGSWIAITRHHAWKVKKPVNFGFLDFSTLAQRRHFCEREVALNRRLGPDVYLRVVPIRLKRGRLSLLPDGQIVEYAIQMRRLSERHFLPRLLERAELTTRDLDRIITTLRLFYETPEPAPAVSAWGRVARLRISTDENFRQMRHFIGATISRAAFAAIRHYTGACYRRHASLFAARVRAGRIRDCHGDLHLEHIHLTARRLTIYDCIEFNDRLRYLDIASDLAFLAMDFDTHGRPDLARYFASGLARALGDPGILRLLDFYKCYRACVRGKVEMLREFAAGTPETERRACRARARRYFLFALRYSVCGPAPMVLIVMGRVGTGKSTLAQALGRELEWEVFSSDRTRKQLAGLAPHLRATEPQRRRLYSRTMTGRTYAALTRAALAAAREGRGAILDATFGSLPHRNRLRRALQRAGVAFCFLETRAPTRTIVQRLAARAHSAHEISDARLEDRPMLDRAYQPPRELARRHFLIVKSARPPDTIAGAVLKTMALRHAATRASELRPRR